MSEISSYEVASISAIEYQSDESDNSVQEEINDTVLYNLVFANANVHIRCYWLQDRVMTLSEAMNAYHSPITNENMEMVIADVLQLLANPVIGTEESFEQDEPEEEESAKTEEADQKSNTKTEAQEVQEDSKTLDAKRQLKKETDRAKHLEPAASRAEKTAGSEGSNVIAAEPEPVAELARSESEQFAQSVVRAGAAASSSNSSADTTGGNGPGVHEALTVTNSTLGSLPLESVTDENDQEFRPLAPLAENQFNEAKLAIKSKVEAKQQILTFEIPEADVAANPIVEPILVPDRPELATDQETNSPTLPEVVEANSKFELTELSILDFESAVISDDTIELSDKKNGAAEYESALATLDYEEDDLEPDELHILHIPTWKDVEDKAEAGASINNESNLSGQMEIISSEQLVQNSLVIEEIEDTLIQLSERIEVSEPKTTEKVNEILDEIIDVPVKLEAHNDENTITEVEAQEELEELFTELLDRVGIDYTPELIESLASLTLKWHLADEIEKLRNEEETDKAPPGSGAHKIIKKLLAGLSKVKKAIAHACAIGKSALQLYGFNPATQRVNLL